MQKTEISINKYCCFLLIDFTFKYVIIKKIKLGGLILKLKKIGKVAYGQDGAIFGGFLFRFDHRGNCTVYKIDEISEESVPFAKFTLCSAEFIVPHSNSVMFGSTYYSEGDEFPLLYTNVYNNYQGYEDKRKGITCVYRLERHGNEFSTQLVQIIEIDFTEDPVWASENQNDIRPYGNFVIDTENEIFYAFTMRDEEQKTRYFSFKMPSPYSGRYDAKYETKKFTITKEQILDYFDCDYHRFVQGASLKDGIIYSTEGFTNDKINRPALRLIDPVAKKQKAVYYFSDFGTTIEPELVDFDGYDCYYADNEGNVYKLTF